MPAHHCRCICIAPDRQPPVLEAIEGALCDSQQQHEDGQDVQGPHALAYIRYVSVSTLPTFLPSTCAYGYAFVCDHPSCHMTTICGITLHCVYRLLIISHRNFVTSSYGNTIQHHISLWHCYYITAHHHIATWIEQTKEQGLHVQTELWAWLGGNPPPPPLIATSCKAC